MIPFILCFLPTVWELWNDRHGETAKDKVQDFLVAVVLYCAIALINMWVFGVGPWRSIALMLGVRLAFFDYAIQYILIRRGVIQGHWFYVKGKTAKWDRVIGYLNPWLVLAVRVVVFGLAVWLFLI